MGKKSSLRALFACVLLAAITHHAEAEPLRISGAMQPNGDVKTNSLTSLPRMSPNGASTVFIADADTENREELYVVPNGGGARVKLSGTISAMFGNVVNFLFTPDSNRVVYLADADVDETYNIYSVNLAGNVLFNLSGPMVSGGSANSSYRMSADGSRIVFLADKETAGKDELWSVATTGPAGSAVKISGTLVAGGQVQNDFLISPDNTRVVFRASKDSSTDLELYSVPIAGGVVTKISGPLVTDGDVIFGFAIAPDSSRVVYWATQDDADIAELYSVPIAGGVPTKLSGFIVTGGSVVGPFAIAPNGSRVVFRADKTTDETIEVFSVPIAGGSAPIPLNGPLIAGGNVIDFVISPDSTRVVFRADKEVDGAAEIYSVPIAGGVLPVNLSNGMVTDGDVTPDYFVSPNSARVVFRADKEVDNRYELYSVPITGGTVVKVSGTMVAGGNIGDSGPGGKFAITPDSARVVFVANKDTVTVTELWSTPLTGGTPTKISGTLTTGGAVANFTISPTGSPIAFAADKDIDNTVELYSTMAGNVAMDIDGNGFSDPLTDGLLMMRWMMGIRGPALIANAVGPNATRLTFGEIEEYLTRLDSLIGPN